jgi:hypothetical protein
MKEQLEITRKTRAAFVYLCKNLSMEQMNYIPEGFNNNIIWNFGQRNKACVMAYRACR